MSYKTDIAANYLSQAYVIVVGMVVVPSYVRMMGTEAYGLISFFAVLQACFQIMDMGLSATIVRETSQFRGGVISARSLRNLLRALEALFAGMAVIVASAVLLGSDTIAHDWLQVRELATGEVRNAIMLMALIAAFRWIAGLYRGIITGFQQLVWLSGFNALVATFRFLLVIPVMISLGATPAVFFGYQVLMAVLEALVLLAKAYRCLPSAPGAVRLAQSMEALRRVYRFSLGMAVVSVVWLLLTQADKAVLSRMLTLGEYAEYNVAVMLAGGLLMASAPIVTAMLPRLNKSSAQKDYDSLYALYRHSTQIVAAVTFPAAAVLAVFAEQVLWIWTGNPDLAAKGTLVLAFHALGNCIMAISSFPSHLQVAEGKLRLYVIGAVLFISLFIPLLLYASWAHGAVGAAFSWFAINLVYLLCWVPLVHTTLHRGLHGVWMRQDIGGVLLGSAVGVVAAEYLIAWSPDRLVAAAQLCVASILTLAAGVMGSPFLRRKILGGIRASRVPAGTLNE